MITKRIEYIDAMRGFTMLLVVYSHILFFGYAGSFIANEVVSFNRLFVAFRMPLFFFISGFILFKKNIIWDFSTCCGFLKKKAKIQLIPTFFFLAIYIFIFDFSIYDSVVDPFKIGYWFTLALFEYFVLYILFRYVCHKLGKEDGSDICLLIYAFLVLGVTPTGLMLIHCYDPLICNVLGVSQMKYFLFFALGTLVRKHFDKVQKMLDNGKVTALFILLFFLIVFVVLHYGYEKKIFFKDLYFIFSGAMGLMLVFAFFRKYQNSFTQNTKLGRILQYIGRRTLDIYLLHYFFLPRNLKSFGQFFAENTNPTLEFFVSMAFAIVVVAICLLMSNIIRISPILGHYLFGVRLEK